MNKNHARRQVSRRHHPRRMLKVAFSLFLQAAMAVPAFAIEADKASHFAGGGAAGLAVDTVMYHFAAGMGPPKRIATSTALSLIPGLIIEIIDEVAPKTSFSGGDLLADGLGALTGVMAAELINGQFWISASGRQIRLIGRW